MQNGTNIHIRANTNSGPHLRIKGDSEGFLNCFIHTIQGPEE